MEKKHHFYGKPIIRRQEKQYIQEVLKKYQDEPVNDELRKKIYEDLVSEKHLGRLSIPFKVLMKRDPSGKYPSYIEVMLDTKV